MAPNLYRIDDLLLRVGAVALLPALALFGAAVGGGAGGNGPWLAGLSLCPVALLVAGFGLRRREKQIVAVWNLLQQNAEIAVPGLLANSDFEREDLERAVRFLNNRGLDHYVWDRESDTIQDARLRSLHLHVEKCDACGGSIQLEVPVAFREVPRCPYCDDPVSFEVLEERRREALESLRAEGRPPPRKTGSLAGFPEGFNPVVFLVLLVVCWPAAIAYAWLKWQGSL